MSSFLKWYLIAINVFAFLLFTVDLKKHTKLMRPTWLFALVTVAGGALGTNLFFLFFSGKLKKRSSKEKDYFTLWRIFAFVMLVLQFFLLLWLLHINIRDIPELIKNGGLLEFLGSCFKKIGKFFGSVFAKIGAFFTGLFGKIKAALAALFAKYSIKRLPEVMQKLIWYLIAVNVFTFLLFGIDKHRSVRKKYRIPEFWLLAFSFIGGSVGGLLGMAVFRHKTQKKTFTIGLHVMLALQILLILYLKKQGVI